jgi:hypothetical protein
MRFEPAARSDETRLASSGCIDGLLLATRRVGETVSETMAELALVACRAIDQDAIRGREVHSAVSSERRRKTKEPREARLLRRVYPAQCAVNV